MDCIEFLFCSYDKASLQEGTRLALLYFKNHSFVHTPLYARMVFCHAYALVIDMATLFFFDFMLHVRPFKVGL